jgi:uncharacterized protein (DUF488 family)
VTLYTIGHSTRTLDELISALKAHDIKALADIRAFPMSRRLPQFNRDDLGPALHPHGILYRWFPKLGGRRKRVYPKGESPNVSLRSDSFRNYADYMLTNEFAEGMEDLLTLAASHQLAYMCAERVYFRCHRMLVSDWLTAQTHEVLHIDDERPPKPHALMRVARLVGSKLLYDGDESGQERLAM